MPENDDLDQVLDAVLAGYSRVEPDPAVFHAALRRAQMASPSTPLWRRWYVPAFALASAGLVLTFALRLAPSRTHSAIPAAVSATATAPDTTMHLASAATVVIMPPAPARRHTRRQPAPVDAAAWQPFPLPLPLSVNERRLAGRAPLVSDVSDSPTKSGEPTQPITPLVIAPISIPSLQAEGGGL